MVAPTPGGLKACRTGRPTLGGRMVNRALYAVLALAAVFAALLLMLWPAGSRAPTPPVSPVRSAVDEPPKPDAPPPPSTAPETPVARQEVEVPGAPTASAPTSPDATGSVVLRGTIAIWGETKPFPVMRVRARDVGTGEALLEGDSSPDGTYVLSREFPVSRAPFEAIVEAEGEGLIPAVGSRSGIEVKAIPFDRDVLPLALFRPTEVSGRVAELFSGNPIVGARVSQVWREDWLRFGPKVREGAIPSLLRTTTDPWGSFRALVPAVLRRGNLVVEREGYVPRLLSWETGPPASTIEILLARSEHLPRIVGKVLDGSSRPVPGARVRADWMGGKGILVGPLLEALEGYALYCSDTRMERTWTATADGDGRFAFHPHRLGAWRLLARGESAGVATATVEVLDAGEVECELRVGADAVTFLVTVRARRGERPVGGAEVFASPAKDPPGRAREFQFSILRTDGSGRVRLGPVPREAYRFSCRAKGFAPGSVDVSPSPDETETCFTVELDEECRLRGTAVDEEGSPLAGAAVFGQAAGNYLGEPSRADGTGVFEVGALPADVEIEFGATAFRYPGPDLPRIEYRSDPIRIRFSTPGEARDLGRVILRRK